MTTANDWHNLIIGSELANPLALTPHPRNFYTHPMQQRKVVNAAIDDIGYVDEVVVNRTTNRIVNGHLRVELAIGNGEDTIPVTWIACDEETETRLLIFFDRIGEMAKVDGERVKGLIDQVEVETAPLQDMLDEWAATFEKFSRPKPAPAPVAAAPVAAAPAPAANPASAAPVVAQAAPTPVAAAAEPAPVAGVPAGPTLAPAPDYDITLAVTKDEQAPIVDTPVAAAVAEEATPATMPSGASQEAQDAPPTVEAPVAQAPVEPADNYEAAILEDGGEAVNTPEPAPAQAPARALKPEKPPLVVIKVGEYDQELPEALFIPWWNELVAKNGGDWNTIVADVRARLQLPDDPC